MSNIIDYLQKILSSRYGKDVRQAIHDGILTCYEDGKAGAIDLVARERIDALESSALVRKIVDSLPTSNISTTTVYMIPSQQSSQDNIYDEYMYINESWEKIGSSAVDLTDYLKKDGDSSNNTVTFTSGDSESATEWTDVGVLASGEKHSSFLTKTSTMFKNIRFLKNFLGNNDISALGDGTVTGGLVSLNDSLTSINNNLIKIKLSTYSVPCGTENTGSTLPFKGVLDLSKKSDFVKNAKAVIPVAAYTNNDKFGVASITSKQYLNVAGDNLTYTCVVAYLY